MKEQITVSVCMITYNHEKYIEDAIKGVLSQQTDSFKIELIIGNDGSTDDTLKVCADYENQYPELIKVFTPEKNIGMMPNFIATLKRCTGKYIALCEGDDYWSDPHKLQKQVTFLENHSEYVGCYHNTEERYQDGNAASYLYSKFREGRAVDFYDLAALNHIPTCSVLFRNFNMDELPGWYVDLNMGDWTLHILNAVKGPFWFIPHVMAVHRLHINSTWMLQDQKRNEAHVLKAYDTMIGSDSFTKEQTEGLKRSRKSFANQYSLASAFKNKLRRVLKDT